MEECGRKINSFEKKDGKDCCETRPEKLTTTTERSPSAKRKKVPAKSKLVGIVKIGGKVCRDIKSIGIVSGGGGGVALSGTGSRIFSLQKKEMVSASGSPLA